MTTEGELWKHIEGAAKDLAESEFRFLNLDEYTTEEVEVPEDLDPDKTWRVMSGQVYGSSAGPSLDRILWADVKPEESDLEDLIELGILTEEEADYGPEWMYDEVDNFVDWGSSIVAEENPNAEYAYAFIEDNCVWVHVIEEVTNDEGHQREGVSP